MDDINTKSGVVVYRSRQRDDNSLVPVGTRVSPFVDSGGALAVGVHPEDGVRLQRTMSPVDVLEVLRGAEFDFYFVSRRHGSVKRKTSERWMILGCFGVYVRWAIYRYHRMGG